MGDEGSHQVAIINIQNDEPCFPLLSVPQLALIAIVQLLKGQDRWRLASACRSLAKVVSEVSQNTRLTITSFTRWKGLSSVLAARTMTCKSVCINGRATASNHQPGCFLFWRAKQNIVAEHALDILLRPGKVLEGSLPGVRLLYLEAQPLPCLLPPRLASLLPDLEELIVPWDAEQFADSANLQPIPYCSSLRKIRCCTFTPQLPSKYHTSGELRRQLPNVTSLEIFLGGESNEQAERLFYTLVNAWSGQLTDMVIKLSTVMQPIQLQHCTCLRSLNWKRYALYPWNAQVFGVLLPQSLSTLHVFDSITEADLGHILQLPLLQVFTFDRLVGALTHDWSKHTCSWKKLTVHRLPLLHLSKLPLISLAGEGCLEISELQLPDFFLPDSLSEVQHAAQCVSNAGIIINGFKAWCWQDLSHVKRDELRFQADSVAAQMLHAACRVVRPPSKYDFKYEYDMQDLLNTIRELISWLSPQVRHLHMYNSARVPTWVWGELYHCRHLERLSINVGISENIETDLSRLVVTVAESYVAVIHQPIIMVFTVVDIAYLHRSDYEDCSLGRTIRSKLEKELPASVLVVGCAMVGSATLKIVLKPA